MGWSPAADAWLSGFIDGEATFTLGLKRRQSAAREVIGVQPWFAITLRADDVSVLDELAAAFGGKVRWHSRSADDGSRRAPRYGWNIAAKADLLRLVEYLDRFPLRAKKARDYAIWRRAVVIYCSRGFRDPELAALRDQLMGGRVYREPSRLRSVA